MIRDRMGVTQIPTFQVWKNNLLADQYVAGKSIAAVPKAVAQMVDKQLTCQFSLEDELAAMDFDAVDTDGSGTISQKEFEGTFSTLGYPRAKIEEAFKCLDQNGDGAVSRLEFENFCIELGKNDSKNDSTYNSEDQEEAPIEVTNLYTANQDAMAKFRAAQAAKMLGKRR